MPNANRVQTVYMSTGNPDTINVTELGRMGELGQAYDWNDRGYQLVKVDSGCTASTGTGVVAANQLAFWKDRSQYLVTNNSPQALFGVVADSYRNNVAGIFRNAVTAGNYTHILIRGRNIAVKEAGSATQGMLLVANTSSVAADSLGIAVNTAATNQLLGVVRTATVTTTCYADVDIPNIP